MTNIIYIVFCVTVNGVTLTTVIFVEDWITVGVLTQVGRWNTLRLVNTLSEARETGEID